MKRKTLKFNIVLILFISALVLFSGCNNRGFVPNESVQLHVENYYTVDGLIHDFKDAQNPQILSESIALYLQYLAFVGDAERFQQQVDILADNFIVHHNDEIFVKWILRDNITVNALIDDLRIAEALISAANRFNEPSYHDLADDIIQAIKSNMIINGSLRDFYDWHYGLAYSELFLSYYNVALMEYYNFPDAVFEPLEQLIAAPFFLERYVNGSLLPSNPIEVNMIDQSLIAIAYFERMGQVEPNFQQFLEERLAEDGKIFARYYRDTGINSNENQSSAVYAFLLHYFELTGQSANAEKTRTLLRQMETFNPITTHFFDFINKELALISGLRLSW